MRRQRDNGVALGVVYWWFCSATYLDCGSEGQNMQTKIIALLLALGVLLAGCGTVAAPPKPTATVPSTKTVVSTPTPVPTLPVSPPTKVAGGPPVGTVPVPTPVPTPVPVCPAKIAPTPVRAYLGSTLGGFAGVFGQPTDSAGRCVWVDGIYTVITSPSDPISSIIVAGTFPSQQDELYVCEGFLPVGPIMFEKRQIDTYYFLTTIGEVEVALTQAACSLQVI